MLWLLQRNVFENYRDEKIQKIPKSEFFEKFLEYNAKEEILRARKYPVVENTREILSQV